MPSFCVSLLPSHILDLEGPQALASLSLEGGNTDPVK